MVDLSIGERFVIADIPGLIEGASEGVGIGTRFLGHVERTAVLIHLVDGTEDDVAQAFVNWRAECKSTIRNSYQILSRGTPNLENEMWNVSAQVLNGTLTPEAAGAQLEDGLKKWYAPHQK